jgi:transposase
MDGVWLPTEQGLPLPGGFGAHPKSAGGETAGGDGNTAESSCALGSGKKGEEGIMALYVRELKEEENRQLRRWIEEDDSTLRHRARVILLSSQGYRIPEIGALLGAHPTNLRKWIHRFNARGPEGLISPRSGGPPPRFTEEQKQQIIRLAKQNPRALGLNFSRWTLHKLAEEARKRKIVDSISHEYVRQILADANVAYRKVGPPSAFGPDSGQRGSKQDRRSFPAAEHRARSRAALTS